MRRNQSLRVYSKGTLGKFAIFFTVLLNACVEDSNNYLGSDVADEAAYNTTIASNAVSNNSGSNKAGSNNAAPGDSAPSIEIISTTQPSVSESTPNVRPSISLSSPSDNADYPVSNDILVSVSASDSDGTVLQVDFYENDRLLGTDTSSPYAFNWRNPTVGSHNIHAVAIDNEGLTAESATHRIFVNEDDPDPEAPSVSEPAPEVRPTITLDSPGDNANYVEGTNIRLSTSASDSDGSVQHVEFYENGALLGADASRPFLFDWTRATVGSHDIHAVAVDNEGLTVESATHRIFVNEAGTTANSASLTIYPATQAIQDQFMSDRFAVRLSQNASTHSSFVYQSDNDANPNWAGTLDYMQAANHWTTFSFEGSVDIEASRLDGNTIRTCVVVPQALNIQTRIQGNSCHFTLNHPAKVSVEIDEITTIRNNFNQIGSVTKHVVKHPLFVFADPLETNPPQSSDPGVLYFGPGIHRIGKQYPLANDSQVYIAGGAYVIGTFISAQSNPSNITIRGSGILSGINLTETATEHNQWRNHSIDFSNGNRGSGLLIEGITITDPLRSCIISYNPVNIQHVKLFSWNHRNDGITAGNDSRVEDSFIKVQDDNIKLYYSNQIIRRNVIWQQVSGAVFKFAWNLSGTAEGNQVSDIDLIHSDVFSDYSAAEEDRPDMHSTSAVFSAMGFKEDAAFQNNLFSGIRIEEKNLLRLMSLRMVSSHTGPTGTKVWGDPDPTASKFIDNLTFENIQLAGVPYKQSTLYGNVGGTIRNFSFINLSVDGTVMTNSAMLSSRNDGTGLLTDGNVFNISFSR